MELPTLVQVTNEVKSIPELLWISGVPSNLA